MQTTTAATQVIIYRADNLAKKSAFSLIEVLVAIAILTVGILAILILFPAGINTLQTAAEFTEADRLGQAELERADASQVQLISAIYPNSVSNANVNPNSLLSSTSKTLNQNSDVDGYRQIVGESVRVPEPVADISDPGHNPISLYTVVANPIVPGTLQINGLPWHGQSAQLTPASDQNTEDVSDLVDGQPQYFIDYTNGLIMLAPEAPGASYSELIQFTVTGSDGIPVSQSLIVPASDVGTAVSLSSLTVNGTGTPVSPPLPWVVGSDKLIRNFVQVNGSGVTYAYSNFTSDPYQWQYYQGNFASTTTNPANIGVIAFNPNGAQTHGVDGQPLEASLNYETYDWHIISEDRSVTSPLGSVKLSLISLLAGNAHDKLTDNTTAFTGLFTYSGAAVGAANPDFIILDVDKGQILSKGTDYSVNYPSGSITFINATGMITGTGGTALGSYVNDHLRIFYHPAKDWAVSLARAPLIYVNDPSANTQPALDHFSVSSTGNAIYFPLADVGKQVDIRLSYQEPTSTTPTTLDSLYTITSPNNAGEVQLVDGLGNGLPVNTTVTNVTVKGISLSAIVIWKENGIWRNQNISTIISNPPVPASTTLQ